MKCEHCDKECKTEREHFIETLDSDGNIIWECSGWNCKGVDWRQRALDAEAKVIQLEGVIRNLYETSNA